MANNQTNKTQQQNNKKKKGIALWWHNMGSAGRIAICCLAGAAVVAAVAVPVAITMMNKQSEPSITVTGATFDKNASSISLSKDSTVVFTYGDDKEFVKINFVKVGDKELTEGADYKKIDNSNSQSKKVLIYAKAMTSIKVEISVELKDKQPGPTPEEKYTITLASDPTDVGTTLTGGGSYVPGTQVTVSATAVSGYTFLGWYDGDTKKSDQLSFSYTTSNTAKTLTAKFEQDKYQLTLASDPTDVGTTLTGGGSYVPGTQVTVSATAVSGYTFLGWYDGDTKKSDQLSFSYTTSNTAKTLTAKFNKNISGTISITGNPIVGQILTASYVGTETITYQWYRGDTAISSATNSTYTLVEDDLGYAIKVKAIGTGSYSGSVESKATEVVTMTYQIDWVTTKFDGTNTLYDLAKTATSIEFLKSDSTDGTLCGETTNDKIYYSFENKALKVWAKNKISLSDNDKPDSTTGIFQNCCDVSWFNFSNIDTSNLTSLNNMFCNCIKITSLDLTTFNTEKVTNIGGLVGMCSELISVDLSSFDTSNVTNMQSVFSTCQKLEKIFVSKKFVVSSVTKTLMSRNMFSDCTSLVGGAGTKFDESKIDKTYARIDQGPDSSAPGYFTDVEQKPYDIDWVTQKVDGTNTLYDLAKTATSIEFLKSDSTEGTHCGETDNDKVYYSLKDGALKIWANKKIAFEDDDCPSNGGVFKNCSEVTLFNFTNIDTSKVTNFASFFSLCKKIESLDLSNFDTSHGTTMKKMFSNCIKLNSLNMDNFNTSNVTNMSDMFNMCKELTTLDLSSFNTSNVADMGYMFDTCESLNTIYVSNNFVTTSVTNSSYMFKSCAKLTGAAGSTLTSIQALDSEHYLDATYARVDKGNTKDTAGYFSEVKELKCDEWSFYKSDVIPADDLKKGTYRFKLKITESVNQVNRFIFDPSDFYGVAVVPDLSNSKIYVNGVELEGVSLDYGVRLAFPTQSKVGDVITFEIATTADAENDIIAKVFYANY